MPALKPMSNKTKSAAPSHPEHLSASVALNRLAYGPDQQSLLKIQSQGFTSWLAEQLSPNDSLDPVCDEQIASFTMPIKYGEHKDGLWPAVDEIRSFQWLNASSEQLMNITPPGKPVSGE